ncbi:MAG: NADH-quinone oxidoreductase subunit M, partial [Thermoplasmata archaeon]|nr:NADH-quinone oxidoreductase subunit M [Thermoplasmata archaeon]
MFEGVPILSIIVLLPLVGVMATFMLGRYEKYAKWLALGASAAAFVLSLAVTLAFVTDPVGADTHNGYQFYESHVWIETLGINYIVGLDGISLPLFVLTTLLCMLSIVFSWDTEKRPKAYFGLILMLEVGVLGVFVSLDYFMFYVFWEIVLIPMYFMIGVWGGPNKDYAAIKFFIYTHIASLAMLIAIMALYFEAGIGTFSMEAIAEESVGFATGIQVAIFAAMLFGFGVKLPMVPFHTWLPDAHVEAPTAGSVLLAGLLLK